MAKMKMDWEIGNIAFLVSMVAILIASFVPGQTVVALGVAALLAIIVAVLNISSVESTKALWVIIGMGIVGGAGATAISKALLIGSFLEPVFMNLGVYFLVISVVFLTKEFLMISHK